MSRRLIDTAGGVIRYALEYNHNGQNQECSCGLYLSDIVLEAFDSICYFLAACDLYTGPTYVKKDKIYGHS